MICKMKNLTVFLKESADIDTLFWKIDKWFERDNIGKSSFYDLVSQYNRGDNKDKFIKDVENSKINVKQFIDFINGDICNQNPSTDYIYVLQKILDTIKDNKK